MKVLPHVTKHAELLQLAPFVFPFVERVQFFRTLIAHDRAHVQGRHQDFLMGPRISLTIRRDHVYEDAFTELARDAGKREGGWEEGGREGLENKSEWVGGANWDVP